MIEKSLTSNADSIILDLEDSVSISQKSEARGLVMKMVERIKDNGKEAIIRINPITTREGLEDLMAVAAVKPNALIIPKADPSSLITVDTMLNALELSLNVEDSTIKLIPLIETTGAMMNLKEILSASKRINGVHLGAEDLSNDREVPRQKDGSDIFYVRNSIALMAKALKLDCIDTPFIDIRDLKGLKEDAVNAKGIGFSGKACIHPAHLGIVNEVFTPSLDEVNSAKEILHAYEEGLRNNIGAVSHKGKMLDKPIAE